MEFEVALYQSERRVSRNSNPLEWWKGKCTAMPILSQLVKRLFCIPATSVPSERVFSAAGHLISAKRNALGEEIVDILLFLYALNTLPLNYTTTQTDLISFIFILSCLILCIFWLEYFVNYNHAIMWFFITFYLYI